MINKVWGKRIPFLAMAMFCMQSVFGSGNSAGGDKTPVGESAAHFDYFTYQGQDDYYNENKLTAKDQFFNPVLPGWYSDPSICTNGEDYFLVTSTFSYFPGVPVFHSKDLVNWKLIGHALDRPSQLILDGQRSSEGIFAPAISYNPHNETYYMVTTNIRRGNFFVKTKDPFGSWSDPIPLPDVHGIDPSFFFDDDGRVYIVNNDAPEGPALYEGHRAIWVREFDTETDKTIGPAKMLVNGGVDLSEKPIWIEGPHIYKINGRYLLMAAEGGTSINHSEVIFYGDSPMGEFKPWDKNPILTQKHLPYDRKNPITCAGHADLIQTKEGDWWSVFLACRPLQGPKGYFENLGRETFLMPVRWSDDGFPYMTQGDELIPMILKREGVVREETVTFGNFSIRDDFDSDLLSPEWMTLRTPAKDLYSLTDNPGYLSLTCSDVSASELKTPAFIARRIHHHKFESEAKMYFDPADENEAAGLLLFKDENHQYFLSVGKSGDNRQVAVEKISDSGSEILASNTERGAGPLQLKITSDGKSFNFYYASEDNKYKLLAKNVDAYYLSTANSWGFTGSTIGLYSIKKAGSVDETKTNAQ